MRPRKPPQERRDVRFKILLTERERARIVEAASRLEVDASALVRRAVKEWIEAEVDRAPRGSF